MNIEDVMETLYEHRVKDLPHNALAEVFDRLIWCLADNGAELSAVKERWLESDSLGKCAIALHMSETFPYETVSEMNARFNKIVRKWPELNERCEQVTNARIQQSV